MKMKGSQQSRDREGADGKLQNCRVGRAHRLSSIMTAFAIRDTLHEIRFTKYETL